MTYQNDCSQFDLAMELLIANGFEGAAETIEILMNSAMQIERTRHLRANPYERTDARRDYANGYKPKTMKTRFGEVLQFEIPQTRTSDFWFIRFMRTSFCLAFQSGESKKAKIRSRRV